MQNPEGIAQEAIKYWVVLAAVGNLVVFLITTTFTYFKNKWTMTSKIETLSNQINGVGTKVKDLQKDVNQNHIEEILRSAATIERLAHVEGILEGMFKSDVNPEHH